MEVILLERVAKLGQIGDVVRVKDGFARNFLLPQGKALRATKESRTRFEGMKAQLEATNLKAKGEAESVAAKLNGQSFIVTRQASDTGQLYGSVSARDIAELLTKGGFTVARNQIALNNPIKMVGLHKLQVALHPEVEVRDHDQRRAQCRGGRASGEAARTSRSGARKATTPMRRKQRRPPRPSSRSRKPSQAKIRAAATTRKRRAE